MATTARHPTTMTYADRIEQLTYLSSLVDELIRVTDEAEVVYQTIVASSNIINEMLSQAPANLAAFITAHATELNAAYALAKASADLVLSACGPSTVDFYLNADGDSESSVAFADVNYCVFSGDAILDRIGEYLNTDYAATSNRLARIAWTYPTVTLS